ncbi:hypothetical protein AV530_005195 [Patagioenas fasciata monilis]|uniref:Uncharacterized protein n=1 Tax=Patagioenas fasciata monilis TaxID=372326 RepID=A0A1V4JKD7_PATFA|nr:hypothetical protein AV530_005195 [Patagioenas fasciata monilis]
MRLTALLPSSSGRLGAGTAEEMGCSDIYSSAVSAAVPGVHLSGLKKDPLPQLIHCIMLERKAESSPTSASRITLLC